MENGRGMRLSPRLLIRRLTSASAVLQATALIALCPALSVFVFAQPAAPTAVKFALDARTEGPEALLFLPEEKRYFKAEGLDLELSKMASPLDPLARLASGAFDIGFADLTDLIRYRGQNPAAPLKAVFIVYNKPPHAVVARRSRGVTEPKRIEGKKLGASASGPAFQVWPLFAKLNGIDVARVTIETIGIPLRVPMLAAGQIDAAVGASFRLYVDLKDRGVPAGDIVLMVMADYGVKLYGSAIVANSKFAAKKPEAVSAFLNAFTKGLKETIREPIETVDLILKHDDAARKEVELERMRMMLSQNVVTPEVERIGLGGVDLSRFEQSIEQIALIYPFKSKPKPEDVIDLSFLPPPADRKIK
jgi:NitT/TauT family transport system substrate-binding protein